jgi:hypothetical protein
LKPEIYPLRDRPPWPREGTTANFVSTLGLEPEPLPKTVVGHRSSIVGKSQRPQMRPGRYSITGTFNLFVKDRIAFRLSGAPSGPKAGSHKASKLSPRNLLNLSRTCERCQLYGFTGLPQLLHIPCAGGRRQVPEEPDWGSETN